MSPTKPIDGKAYGSIPHLPMSRLGPRDYSIHEGQAKILTEKTRDKHDLVIVTEKLDGACCAVAKLDDGQIVALTRSGNLADTSDYPHHQHFAEWVRRHRQSFEKGLHRGDRIVGEYLGMAHGSLYDLGDHEPFFAFDIFEGKDRISTMMRSVRCTRMGIQEVPYLHLGDALPVEQAMELLGPTGRVGTLDGPPEGVVYRVERQGQVDFLAKFVAHDKQDGKYFTEKTGQPPIYMWRP